MTDLPLIPHWINGAAVPSTSGRTAPVFDPALGVATKNVGLANRAEIDAAIGAASLAFPAWRDASLAKRTQVMFAFRELLNARKGELAEIITSEHGKVLSDALGEIARGQEVVEFACGIQDLLKGFYSENASTNVDVYTIRQPLGVVGVISPFNFPAMVPLWFVPVAIAAGNTHSLALTDDGRVFAWGGGAPNYGHLGNGANVNNTLGEVSIYHYSLH
jgi:malonate-semialdehyde dehydrogenase (acetylating)/methylmalonate-semialdehyde dehydrogenase